jgi:cytochrome P450
MTDTHVPVTDWTTDFDHTDPGWVNDPYPIWDDLRERCPVAHTARWGGAWLPTRHADVAAVAYDTEHFSSQGVVISNVRPDIPAPIGPAPPITSDPPFHAIARRLLLPGFAPKVIEKLEPSTRDLCNGLLDAVIDQDGCDASAAYAQHIPVTVIANMLGFPLKDAELFRRFVHHVLESVAETEETRLANAVEFETYIDAQIDAHRAEPRDDLTTFLIDARIDGQPLSQEHIRGTMVLLLIAGIDTTWSAIGASLWHLAQHPEDRARLVADPGLLPTAMEEFLRAYGPVTMARIVAEDVELHGQQLHAGDWVLLPFPSANRDPEQFPDADKVLIDREVNRHSAFGLGIHRCLGSNLARMELRIALETWLARIPDFELADPAGVTWAAGQVRGPRTLPIRFVRTAS